MPLSIFSSDRATGVITLRQALIGLIAGILILTALELFWREQGATPAYVDSKPRWSAVREQATARAGVVLIGDSRMQFGFSLQAFRTRYPEMPVYQLAVAAERPYATLVNLAEDEKFHGTVVMSFEPDLVLPFRHHEQQAYVDHYRKRWTLDTRLNLLFRNVAEQLLVTRHHSFGINELTRGFINGHGLPQAVRYLHTYGDREIDADYSNEDRETHRRRREDDGRELYERLHPVSTTVWRAEFERFLVLTRLIEQRGGCVIVVRFPSQGRLYDYEQRLFPKSRFWSQIEEQKQLRAIHFEDLAAMSSIELPDFQHIAKDDKKRFTDALLDAVAVTKASAGNNCML